MSALLPILLSGNLLIAHADCTNSYSEPIKENHKRSDILILSGLGITVVGGYLFVENFDWEGSDDMAYLGLGLLGTGGVMTSFSNIYKYEARRLERTNNLLLQAQFEEGFLLNHLSRTISRRQQQQISISDIALVINQGNEEKVFCQENQKLYDIKDIRRYIEQELD